MVIVQTYMVIPVASVCLTDGHLLTVSLFDLFYCVSISLCVLIYSFYKDVDWITFLPLLQCLV